MHFRDVDVTKKGNQLVTDLYVKPTKYINIFMLVRVTFPNAKNKYLLVKPCVLTECVLKTPFLINDIIEVIWLKEKGYSDKSMCRQILKARKFSRSEVLNK